MILAREIHTPNPSPDVGHPVLFAASVLLNLLLFQTEIILKHILYGHNLFLYGASIII
jgi:hypothetical protein